MPAPDVVEQLWRSAVADVEGLSLHDVHRFDVPAIVSDDVFGLHWEPGRGVTPEELELSADAQVQDLSW